METIARRVRDIAYLRINNEHYGAISSNVGKDSLRDWVRSDGDPGSIAKKALTNMVMEKAKDYPEPKPGFMQI